MSSQVLLFRLPASAIESFSESVWAFDGVMGVQESPLDGSSLFAIRKDFEILEFGSDAARRAADWLETEAYRGSEDLLVKVYLDPASPFARDNTEAHKLAAQFRGELLSSTSLESTDYLENYKASVKGVSLGPDLWMGPPWQKAPQGTQYAFFVEPGLAFGTGDHPTTQLCLQRLYEIKDQGPRAILDLGTGTGVLAAAARKFFPKARLYATDLDPVCEHELERTFRLNGLEGSQVTGRFGESGTAQALRRDGLCFDLIISNIYAEVLATLVDDLYALLAPGGRWVASGILEGKPEEILLGQAKKLFRCELRRSQLKAQTALEAGRGLTHTHENWVMLEFSRLSD